MAPWSGFWERNVFAQGETVGPFLTSPFVRGAVSGLGLLTALAGLAELGGAFRRKREAPQEPL